MRSTHFFSLFTLRFSLPDRAHVPFCFAKRWTIEFESLLFILLFTKKRYQGKILDTFSGAEGETRQGKPCLVCFANSPIFCPFCFAKDGLLSSSLSYLFCYSQRKGIKEKSLIPFLARKERLDRASPVLLASQALPFFVPFASQKMDYRVRVSPLQFHLLKKKKHKDNSLCFFWRGRRDSNSRAGFPTYALSRGASSPT